MSYKKRLDTAFENALLLPLNAKTKYFIFSDCHRGIGNNNDNFLKNANNYSAALQYYYQQGFTYIEAGDGDELWENHTMNEIMEIHHDIFIQLLRFHEQKRLYILYGNHDMQKKSFHMNFMDFQYHEGLILSDVDKSLHLYITHGHQADFFNCVLWKITRFLVRYLWTPLEYFGVLDPTSAAKNNTKKNRLEKRLTSYAIQNHCLLLTGHTHRPTLGDSTSPYLNCGSCVHPRCITCIEICGYEVRLIKWCSSATQTIHFHTIYQQLPPAYPLYVKREILGQRMLL